MLKEWAALSFTLTLWRGNLTKCRNGHAYTEENFGIGYKSNGQVYRKCRACGRISAAASIKKFQELDYNAYTVKLKDSFLRSEYGITYNQKLEMLEAQNNTCANILCKKTNLGTKSGEWTVDHNHTTGKVRGLLCNGCNTALGHIEENIDRLKGLIIYLEKHAS